MPIFATATRVGAGERRGSAANLRHAPELPDTDAAGLLNAVRRPESRPNPEEGGTPAAHGNCKVCNGNALGESHIPVKNMMCAFGVPGYMIHGTPGAGFSVIPVDFSVAPGMYTT